MRSHTLSAIVIGAVLVSVWPAAPAQAAATLHTYVAKANGNDGNAGAPESCNITQPCLTLTTTMANTLAGGTITILDEYDLAAGGGLIVDKSLTIEGRPGVNAVFRVQNGFSFSINATAGDVVTLRNLTIIPQAGSGAAGLVFNSGKTLVLDKVWIKGAASSFGLVFQPNTAASGGVSQLQMRDSVVAENALGNILIKPSNNLTVAATLNRVTVRNGGVFGIKADGSGQVTGQIDVEAFESIASSNATNGYIAVSNAGQAPIHFKITRSIAHNNGSFGAVASGAQAFMIVSDSSLARNGTGLSQQSSATVATYTNNDINFNNGGSNIGGTITPITQK